MHLGQQHRKLSRQDSYKKSFVEPWPYNGLNGFQSVELALWQVWRFFLVFKALIPSLSISLPECFEDVLHTPMPEHMAATTSTPLQVISCHKNTSAPIHLWKIHQLKSIQS